jgi:hypothetical protein
MKNGASIPPEVKERWANLAPGPLPEAAAHEATRQRIRSMTPKQLRQSFIDAGIYDSEGRLRPQYGG